MTNLFVIECQHKGVAKRFTTLLQRWLLTYGYSSHAVEWNSLTQKPFPPLLKENIINIVATNAHYNSIKDKIRHFYWKWIKISPGRITPAQTPLPQQVSKGWADLHIYQTTWSDLLSQLDSVQHCMKDTKQSTTTIKRASTMT